MKKFISYLFIFFLSVFFIDYSFGKICQYLNSHAKGGDTKSHYYIAKEVNEEVLIFGSSRAVHHYIPSILSDSLNMSVYNCGTDGNGIIFMYGRLKMVAERYSPKILIYEVTSDFDIKENDNMKYLNWLKRYYDEPGIDSIFFDVSANEKYKMNSNLYRYNTSFIQMLSDNVSPKQTVLEGGFKPMYGVMDYEPQLTTEANSFMEWDPLKKKYFEKFVELCKSKNIQLIFAISPLYKAASSKEYTVVKDYCKEKGLPLFDFYTDSEFVANKKYFADTSHLNNDGATVYTQKFVHRLTTNLTSM